MPHPEVLVEMDLTNDIRWYTVKGKHYAFYGATRRLSGTTPSIAGEESPPYHPGWSLFVACEADYLEAKPRLVPAYPPAAPSIEDRPGLRPEYVDWEAHRAFLRSL